MAILSDHRNTRKNGRVDGEVPDLVPERAESASPVDDLARVGGARLPVDLPHGDEDVPCLRQVWTAQPERGEDLVGQASCHVRVRCQGGPILLDRKERIAQVVLQFFLRDLRTRRPHMGVSRVDGFIGVVVSGSAVRLPLGPEKDIMGRSDGQARANQCIRTAVLLVREQAEEDENRQQLHLRSHEHLLGRGAVTKGRLARRH